MVRLMLPSSSTAPASRPSSTSANTMFQPRSASRRPVANPIPLAPPVITATFGDVISCFHLDRQPRPVRWSYSERRQLECGSEGVLVRDPVAGRKCAWQLVGVDQDVDVGGTHPGPNAICDRRYEGEGVHLNDCLDAKAARDRS